MVTMEAYCMIHRDWAAEEYMDLLVLNRFQRHNLYREAEVEVRCLMMIPW